MIIHIIVFIIIITVVVITNITFVFIFKFMVIRDFILYICISIILSLSQLFSKNIYYLIIIKQQKINIRHIYNILILYFWLNKSFI